MVDTRARAPDKSGCCRMLVGFVGEMYRDEGRSSPFSPLLNRGGLPEISLND